MNMSSVCTSRNLFRQVHEDDGIAGKLLVDVIAARNLPSVDSIRKTLWTHSFTNSYVKILLGNFNYQTSVQWETFDPIWHDTTTFDIPLPTIDDIHTSHNISNLSPALQYSPQPPRLPKYNRCFPGLFVCVYHKQAGKQIDANASNTTCSALNDVLLGQLWISLLPCILSPQSSIRNWYSLFDEDGNEKGQIHLAFHFQVSGVQPIIGDIVRMAGFGGSHYYAKIFDIQTVVMQVQRIFRDHVVVMYTTVEGWKCYLEIHRNLLIVAERPRIIRDARIQIQAKLKTLKETKYYATAIEALPLVLKSYSEVGCSHLSEFTIFAADYLDQALQIAKCHGVRCSLAKFIEDSQKTLCVVYTNLQDLYFQHIHPPTSGLSDNEKKQYQGRIIEAFEPTDVTCKNEQGIESELYTTLIETDTDPTSDTTNCPEELICAITGCQMVDPVVTADGFTYEREAILRWFDQSDISPSTGARIASKEVFDNVTLRRLAESYGSIGANSSSLRCLGSEHMSNTHINSNFL